MHSTLWTDQQAESGSTDSPTATTTDAANSGEPSPFDAAIEASSWDREDIELALDVVQTVLLAVWLYLALKDD